MADIAISPRDFHELLDNKHYNVIPIDTRNVQSFNEGHIQGAYVVESSNDATMQSLQTFFAEILQNHGVSGKETLVVYEEALNLSSGASCRGWFILKYLGCKNVKVLHGGYKAWLSEGFPISTAATVKDKVYFSPKINLGIMCCKPDILKALDKHDTVILDCRGAEEWKGMIAAPRSYGPDYCPRKGRIPGAKWIDWLEFIHTNKETGFSSFKTPDETKQMLEQNGISKDNQVLIYCFKGSRASTVMITMLLAGYHNVKNYFGSWNEWSRDLECPIDSKQL